MDLAALATNEKMKVNRTRSPVCVPGMYRACSKGARATRTDGTTIEAQRSMLMARGWNEVPLGDLQCDSVTY